MLPDQMFDAVSRSVSNGGGSKSLLTQPARAAIHQTASSRTGPTASSMARRSLLVVGGERAIRMAVRFLGSVGRVSLALRPPGHAYLRAIKSKENAEKCNCMVKYTNPVINLHSCSA